MTTPELYQALGVSGYEHEACWRKNGAFHLRMRAPASSYRCPQCGNRDVIRRGFNDSQHRQVVAEETIRQASLRDLEVLAIDEIDVGRKNKYFTFVIDWRTGASVYVGDGKGQQVFDRFHIPKPMNDKLTQLRREVQSEAETMDRKALKGLRWLLLKHPENLDESKNERVRLQEALDLNRSLSVAYYLKEDPSQIWQ